MKTTYNNIIFKSRLETLWARHFDEWGLSWSYEPETFRDGRYSYTPDYRVDRRVWVEVKGRTIPMNRSIRLCPRPLIVLCGPPTQHTAILVLDTQLIPYPSWGMAYRGLFHE